MTEHASSDWRHRAACASHDPESWFPLGTTGGKAASEVCTQQCPVRDACAVTALAQGHNDGIWAGYLLPVEKAALRRHVQALTSTSVPCEECGTSFTAPTHNRHSRCVPCRLGLADAAEVIDHLDLLAAVGMDLTVVAEAAGVKLPTLREIVRGVREGVRPDIAAAILSITVEAPTSV